MASESYLGNPLLRTANKPVEYTPEQVEEYMKCAEDPFYFIEKYIKIVNVDKGLIPMELYDFQKKIIKTVHENRFSVFLMARQVGKSSTIVAYLLHYVLFNPNMTVAILANKGPTAKELLEKFKTAYENLPGWLQQGIKEWNKLSIVLENGCKIITAATSSTGIRGMALNMIVLDEFAFVPFHIADQFMSSVYPTISSGKSTKMVIISTPNGMNHFHKIWTDAKNKKNQYVAYQAYWNEVPGRDEKFKKETISNIGELKWRQEFACEFIGSQQTLLDVSTLTNFTWDDPIYTNTDGLAVYEAPIKDHNYLITVDTGKGNEMDYHAFSIIDCTAMPYKQVARFRNNTLAYQMYPSHIAKIAKEYNNAHVFFELNDLGLPCANILRDELEYENIVTTINKGSAGQRADGFGAGKTQLGVVMSSAVKKMGCSTLKDFIESGKLIIPDYETQAEFSTFIAVKNSYEAEEGYHDDIISTLILFGWLSTQQFFKDFTDTDIRKKLYELNIKRLEQEMLPFGFRVDGSETEEPDEIDIFDERSEDQKRKDAGRMWEL